MRSRTALLVSILWLSLACERPRESEPAPTPPARPTPSAPSTPAGLVAPSALAGALPQRLGSFEATGAPEPHVELGVTPTTRVSVQYADGERRATVRVVDAQRAPDLVAGFAAAQRIPMAAEPEAPVELVPTGIAGRPALASWVPGTSTSEAQVVVADRFVVALTIAPASVPEEAVDVLETFPFASLEALGR
ncbi:hypothetical protein [Sandaracinus amylolyticus]|uniref:hypothetical protein n=1 Tax=Sandaracinus amylolyticus TaxID=927083 RepID=UPI001F2EA7F8|nr:hypothetical protein [Sandaracinus amylolyticus]UJR83073.1 Hypothetical protein I5071_51390 [Sandaracinus amylolyticus]